MRAFCFIALLAVCASCKHQVESYSLEPVSDYYPLTIGSYNIYALDSTVFVKAGRQMEVHHYQEKQLVGGQVTDNLNRPTYRIDRFLSDSAGTTGWRSMGSFYVTPTSNSIEKIENGLRTVRLMLPIQAGATWRGNNYLPDDAYEPVYDFSNDNYLTLWEYTYGDKTSETYNGVSLTDVMPVYQMDENVNASLDNFKADVDTATATRDYAIDKYAKGVGLVYQELIMWELEPNGSIDLRTNPPTRTFDPYYKGFGVRRQLLEHH